MSLVFRLSTLFSIFFTRLQAVKSILFLRLRRYLFKIGCKGTTFFRYMQGKTKIFLVESRKSKVERQKALPRVRGNARMSALGNGITDASDPIPRRRRASRANPSYMYLNYVQVVNTRGSSALPNRRLPSCRGPRGKFTRAADPIQHHKFSSTIVSWSLRRPAGSSARGRSAGRS